MSDLETVAEQAAQALGLYFDIAFEPEQDMRSGGWFFDMEDSSGNGYTVLITDVPS